MLVIFFRSLILYLLVTLAVRLMGKRQVSEIQPSELVAMMIISDIASIPMQSAETPLLSGALPIFIVVVLEVIISYINSKSKIFRKLTVGKPSIIIHDGKIIRKEADKLRLSMDDIIKELRIAGCANILDVHYGIVETNGKLSVILKKDKQPATAADVANGVDAVNQHQKS